MKILITENGRRHYYYEDGDIVNFSSDNTEAVFEVYKVDIVKKLIITQNGVILPLSTNVRPTKETLNRAKVDDRRKSKEIISNPLSIKVKYFDKDMPKLTKIEKGDWIDVRISSIKINGEEVNFENNKIEYKKGDFIQAYLGFAMELPKGYEAHVAPRGSSFKNFGTIQVNSVGIVDESFKGDNDQWFIPLLAMRDSSFDRYDRIGQFRVIKKMPPIDFVEVDNLDNLDRGGHGSTGVK